MHWLSRQRLDRNLAQWMSIKTRHDMPDVMGLSDPHHHIVGIILDVDLAIVIGIKSHRVQVIEVPIAKRVFGELTEGFGIRETMQVPFLDQGVNRWIFRRESQQLLVTL